jgi:hypothetical protein
MIIRNARRTAKYIGRLSLIPSGVTRGQSGFSFAGITRRSIFKRQESCEPKTQLLFCLIVLSRNPEMSW